MKQFKDWIVDKYLTWKTGKSKDEREWSDWYDNNVNWLSNDITNMFEKFKHVIPVSHEKFLDYNEPFAWVPVDNAMQYFWPYRELGNNAVWRIERVIWNQWDCRWHINEIGGEDKVFVATNNDTDAMMIALKYAG